MIGKLLKDLIRALFQYAAFQLKRPFVKGAPVDNRSSTNVRANVDPFPSLGSTHGDNSSLPPAPPHTVPALYQPRAQFDWQILSDSEALIYVGGPSVETLNLLRHEPKFLLDVGCSNGDFAVKVKERFPQSTVWGVEPSKSAAAIAAGRIDRVIPQTIEQIDWKKEGVERGDIDTVLLFDVLEHIYDPWTTLLKLRNLVNGMAQLIVSIPNVRNVLLLQDLVAGHWRYRKAGLLDITHIRFFTQKDMYRMFYQTGFRVTAATTTRCSGSSEIFAKYSIGKFPKQVMFESASVTVHSIEDLVSLCTLQHMFALQPAEYEELSASERQWIDASHPATAAFGFS